MFCSVTMGNAMKKMPRDNTFVPDRSHNGQIAMKYSRGVLNYVTKVVKPTKGKLIKGNGWKEWRQSEWKQLDQYDKQEMFGEPLKPVSWKTVFCLAWTYVEKVLDKWKKARCTCDLSMRAGRVRILDHSYVGCIEHITSRLFYAISAAESLMICGVDVTNAFSDDPSPKQGLHILQDRAFHDW